MPSVAGPRAVNKTLTVRRALADDASDLFRWRNDPLVRAMSRNKEPIPEEAHFAWYNEVLRDPTKLLLIGAVGCSKIGMVRFDRHTLTVWAVSILLAPEAQGRGLGKDLLKAGLDRLESLNGPSVFLAEILNSNTRSIRLFESLGFRLEGSDQWFWRFRRT